MGTHWKRWGHSQCEGAMGPPTTEWSPENPPHPATPLSSSQAYRIAFPDLISSLFVIGG